MNTAELDYCLKKDFLLSKYCEGVFPVGMLPTTTTVLNEKLPTAFIVNLDPSTLPGSHWVALYFDKDKQCEYFDSYGRRVSQPTLKNYVKNRCSHEYVYNDKMLQSPYSDVCRQYCLFYLYHRVRQCFMNEITCLFTHDLLEWNDCVVKNWVVNMFRGSVPPSLPGATANSITQCCKSMLTMK